MAIFRAGKRLGPFDIRVGFPRDKSLDRVDQDPRLRQQGNDENTIGRFRSAMAAAEGYARTTRFAIRIFPPTNLESIVSKQSKGLNIHGKGTDKNPDGQYMNSLSQSIGRQVNVHCDSIEMPGHDLQTQSVQYGSAPAVDMVQAHAFAGQITASFYADKYLRERTFFEKWQQMAVNIHTHKANYYNTYIGRMQIFQLSSLDQQVEKGHPASDFPTYGIEATEVYPATISAVPYNYSGNNIVKVNVGFNYKLWYNLVGDSAGGMDFGSNKQSTAEPSRTMDGMKLEAKATLDRAPIIQPQINTRPTNGSTGNLSNRGPFRR